MIAIYCRANHYCSNSLCEDCSALEFYAHKRLGHCRFGNKKPSCKHCPTHCYKADMRVKIQEVMRFSGPRMMLRDPVAAIRHLYSVIRNKNRF